MRKKKKTQNEERRTRNKTRKGIGKKQNNQRRTYLIVRVLADDSLGDKSDRLRGAMNFRRECGWRLLTSIFTLPPQLMEKEQGAVEEEGVVEEEDEGIGGVKWKEHWALELKSGIRS